MNQGKNQGISLQYVLVIFKGFYRNFRSRSHTMNISLTFWLAPSALAYYEYFFKILARAVGARIQSKYKYHIRLCQYQSWIRGKSGIFQQSGNWSPCISQRKSFILNLESKETNIGGMQRKFRFIFQKSFEQVNLSLDVKRRVCKYKRRLYIIVDVKPTLVV